MTEFGTYLWGVISEGALISFLFWIIVYLTVERTSLYVAIKAGLISEAIGNLPYLGGEGPLGEVIGAAKYRVTVLPEMRRYRR